MALLFNPEDTKLKRCIGNRLQTILGILDANKPLVDCYVSDYFIRELWHVIPKPWWSFLCQLEPEELAYLLGSAPSACRRVWPLSLLAFRSAVLGLCLQRMPVRLEDSGLIAAVALSKEAPCDDVGEQSPTNACDTHSNETNSVNDAHLPCTHKGRHSLVKNDLKTNLCSSSESSSQEAVHTHDVCVGIKYPNDPAIVGDTSSGAATIQHGQYPLLQHCFRRHVKPKKQHEILSLAQTINAVCCGLHLDRVVDVGAGQGHLSRLLSFGHGLKVTTIEAAGCHAPKAEQFDSEVTRDIRKGRLVTSKERKKLKKDDQILAPASSEALAAMLAQPTHVVGLVSPDVSVDGFLATLQLDNHIVNRNQCRDENPGISSPVLESKSLQLGTCCNGLDTSTKDQQLNTSQLGLKDQNADTMVHCNNQNAGTSEVSICSYKSKVSAHDFCDNQTCCHIVNGDGNIIRNGVQYVAQSASDNSSKHGQCDSIEETSKKQPQTTEKIEVAGCHKSGVASPMQFLLTGLHACGDLSPTLLRVFVQCPQARGLAAVSCCYMKMTSLRDDMVPGTTCGYPMSSFLQGLPGATLTWEALEMGCHFLDDYHQRLQENPPSLRSHVYRAALQEIIHDKDPSIVHGSVKLTLKKTHQLTFPQYATKALGRLNLDPSLSPAQLRRAESRLDGWRDIVAFYSLRLCMAPLIETVVLLDRVLYLMEQGVGGCLAPIFDPKLSPRNFVLLAWKH